MLHGWIPPHRFLPYLSAREIEALPDRHNIVVVQPLAAIEQHGPHLPIAVDTAIVCGVLGHALAKLDESVACYCLPPLAYGKSNEHIDYAGTISLSAATLLATLQEVLDSLHRSGFRKIALVNGHGGQPQILEIAARDARVAHRDLSVFPLFVWSVPNVAKQLFSAREMEFGIHAGAAETSLMLALLPETVKMEHALAEYPQGLPEEGLLTMEGARPFAWLTSDLSRSGVLGDPQAATVEKGRALLASLADGWVQLLGDLHRFRQPAASQDT